MNPQCEMYKPNLARRMDLVVHSLHISSSSVPLCRKMSQSVSESKVNLAKSVLSYPTVTEIEVPSLGMSIVLTNRM